MPKFEPNAINTENAKMPIADDAKTGGFSKKKPLQYETVYIYSFKVMLQFPGSLQL